MMQKLGVRNHHYVPVDFDINEIWMAAGDPVLPTTDALTYILDESDVRVLILNGNDDITVYGHH